MEKQLKLLILIKPFWGTMPKHKLKYNAIRALEKHADVRYWYHNNHIQDILAALQFQPDFILHYDTAYQHALSPVITGLDTIDIPKGSFIIDAHFSPSERKAYWKQNKIDLIFSVSKEMFLKHYPDYKESFRWWPFGIDPALFKDWQMKKDIDFLLMGQVYDRSGMTPNNTATYEGKYPFRDEVLHQMRDIDGFVHHPHPGHNAGNNALINKRYAFELNRSKIFLTGGSKFHYPVMKYFEAPACRTLLLADPVSDILELGFEDGKHFIACDKSNFYAKARYYLEHAEERKEITDQGYALIHKHHTIDGRAKQFTAYVEAYLKA